MPSDRLPRDPIDLQHELERAVERNEFGLEYQPIIDLQSGSIAAVEALLRWRHPLLGTIPPADYLPLAEETGLILPIGDRVLETATRQLRTWHLPIRTAAGSSPARRDRSPRALDYRTGSEALLTGAGTPGPDARPTPDGRAGRWY